MALKFEWDEEKAILNFKSMVFCLKPLQKSF